jgi:hypothetical protein
MSKVGYWNVRITPSLRQQLDHMHALMGVTATTDIDAVRFALSFTTAMLPQPLTIHSELEGVMDAVRGDLESLRVYDSTYPISVRARDLEAVVRQRR